MRRIAALAELTPAELLEVCALASLLAETAGDPLLREQMRLLLPFLAELLREKAGEGRAASR